MLIDRNHIKKNYFYMIIFIFIFLNIKNIYASETHEFNFNDPPIYVLKKDNKIIYLLGTIHAARLDQALSQPVRTLLANASLLMIEHPITNTPYAFSAIEKLGDTHDSLKAALVGVGDDEIIVPLTLKKLTELKEPLFTNINQTQEFDFEQLLNYKLWVADLLLAVDLNLKAMTQNGGGMELDLISAVKGQMKPLETSKEIYEIMNQNKEEKNIYIQRIAATLKMLQRLNMRTYLKMNEYNFAGIANMPSHPPAVGKRNILWMPKIMSAFATLGQHQTMVIAVGTGHLSGNEGLLTLLSNQGFTISALNSLAQEVHPPAKFY